MQQILPELVGVTDWLNARQWSRKHKESPENEQLKIIVRSFGSSKNTKLEDGPYCTISGNEPSSLTLYKTGSESQTFCCNF